jgi:glycosyltransferase involved in cell wall biosynthesis
LNEFDVFLHTAQWEGMPNVLIEAAACGLAIVASSVGGVPELVKNGDTGFCITPYDDVDAYCDALRTLHADRSKLVSLAAAAKELAVHRHSWAAFRQTLGCLPEYLTPPVYQGDGQQAASKQRAAA